MARDSIRVSPFQGRRAEGGLPRFRAAGPALSAIDDCRDGSGNVEQVRSIINFIPIFSPVFPYCISPFLRLGYFEFT